MYGKTDVWAVTKAVGIVLAILLCVAIFIWNIWVAEEYCRQNPHPACVTTAHADEGECECTDRYGAEIEWDMPSGAGCGMYFLDD